MSRRIHKVRTTYRPWEVIEVDDATLLDLQRRGQIAPEPDPDPDPDPEPDEPVEPVEDVVAASERGEKDVTEPPSPRTRRHRSRG